MRIKDIYVLFEGLKVIGNKELPVKVAFLVQKNISVVRDELEIVKATKTKLDEKYVDKEKLEENESKLVIENLKEGVKFEDYNKEYDELMNQEVKIKLKKIKIDDLDGITVKPIVLNQLKSILTE